MKKLLSILTLLICLNSAAQYPLTQYISSDSTLLVSRGGTKLRPVIWSYTDTTAANLQRIAQYPFSIIATTSDSSMYFRSLYNNMWIKMAGSSGGTSGAYWGITGNFMSVLPSGFGIGTNSPDNLPFKTDGTIRVILPSTGLDYQNDTTSNKPMVFNTSTKSWGYGSWFGSGGGAIPTWQQTLTAGSVLTTNNSVNAQGYNFTMGNLGTMSVNAGGGSTPLVVYGHEDIAGGPLQQWYANSGSVVAEVRQDTTFQQKYTATTPATPAANYGKTYWRNDSLWSMNDNGTEKNLWSGGGNTNSNVGSGYRLAIPNTNNIKTLIAGTNVTLDTSTSNSIIINSTASGGSTIYSFGQAWVDSAYGNDATARPNRPDLPFATINRALDSLASYSNVIVNIGLGTYDSITESKIRSNLWLKGSKQPTTNSLDTSTTLTNLVITRPTKLINGTIIKGGFQVRNKYNIQITDLGVDNGADWVAAGHRKYDCIDIRDAGTAGGGNPPFRLMDGIRIENVTCLGDTSTSLYHALTLENCIDPIVKNVLLVGNTHGLAVKTVGGIYDGITSYWHSSDGIILKINNYAPSHEMILNNFNIRSLSESAKESGGLVFQNETGVNVRTGWVVSNGAIRFTTEGIRDYASGEYYNVNVSNINIHKTTNSGIYLVGIGQSNINNCIIDSTGGHGIWITTTTGGNTFSNNQLRGNTSYYGMNIAGGSNKAYLFNNIAIGNNYGIVLGDANVYGEDNVATGNTSGQYSGTLNGILKPYLASSAISVVGASTAGLQYPLYIGNGLAIHSAGGTDTLVSTASGGGSTVVSDSAWMKTGNTANAATNYIGTNNSVSFRIKTNGTQRAYYDSVGNYYFYTPSIGTEFKVGTYNDPNFVSIGTAGAADNTMFIGGDASIGYPRLRIKGYSDTAPLLWLGNGGTETNIKFWRYSTNQMGATTPNYNNYPFTFGGNYEFQNKVSIGTTLGANAPTMALQLAGRFGQGQGAAVASANNLALGTDGNVFEITGTTQINLIDKSNWRDGSEVTLIFTSTATVKNGQTTSGNNITIKLAGSADFSATADDVLTLVLSTVGGVQAWREKSRSVN